jgi:UDP-N-acetylglucosamine--N-acetylmuramyl-(pentapeptide) pyrophosphoryl-undecaprenol N-acetylglucosamine transferase
MRLLYSCSELGLGHASRTLALGKHLEQNGHEIHFFTGGKAYTVLQQHFKNVNSATPVAWYENAHGIITTASLINILFPIPRYNNETKKFELKSSSAMETTHRYYDLRRHIKQIKPDLVIADGDIHALRMANRWHIPSVYITNLIRPTVGFSSFLNPGERITERYLRDTQKIVIPDNPPPNTISEYNIGDLDSIGIRGKTEFTGAFTDIKPVQGSEEHIFAPISGPYGTRAKLTNTIIAVLKQLNTRSIISLGIPGEGKTAHSKNLTVHTWLSTEQRQEYMKNAKTVIFSGGHLTCFETIKYAKPSIVIPTQPEQLANGIKLQDMQCAIVAKTRKQLKQALQTIEEKHETFRNNMQKLNAYSNKFNGVKRAAEVIEETANKPF